MNKEPNSNPNKQQDDAPFLPRGLWYIVGTGAILFAILYWLSCAFSIKTEKYTFMVLGGANILIFLAILLQALIYRRQWQVMDRQVRLTRKQFMAVERPFVFRDAVNWVWHYDEGRRGRYWYSIHPMLTNSGNTPTVEMWLTVDSVLRDSPLPERFDFDTAFTSQRRPTIIGPKAQIAGTIIHVLDDDLLAIQKKTKYFYVFGKAEYRDLFEGSPAHVTRFCNQIGEVVGNPLDPRDPKNHQSTTLKIAFEIYREYNSAD